MEDSSPPPPLDRAPWAQALDSWSEFAQRDLDTELPSRPGASPRDVRLLSERAARDLAQLRQRFHDAVNTGAQSVDLSDADGTFNRLTRAGRRRFADLVALRALPLPVKWPPGWERRLARDEQTPAGADTPPTQPSTPRGA